MATKKGVWRKNGGPEYLGGYEYVNVNQAAKNGMPVYYLRYFTLVRIPKKGAVTKRTLYFKSAAQAKAKGWKLV